MKDQLVSWRDLITQVMNLHGETFNDMETVILKVNDYSDEEPRILTVEELDRKFDNGYGGSNGSSFTLWTKNRVYFPVVYDGKEWASSVPRNPCDEAQRHVGGE